MTSATIRSLTFVTAAWAFQPATVCIQPMCAPSPVSRFPTASLRVHGTRFYGHTAFLPQFVLRSGWHKDNVTSLQATPYSSNSGPPRQSFEDLIKDPSHDCYYFVDNNMISAYVKNQIPGWVAYVNHHSKKGKRFFVSDRIRKEYTLGALPAEFHVYSDPDADVRVENAYPLLLERFQERSDKFKVDARWLLECGYCLASCEDIPFEAAVAKGKTFALTANPKLVQIFLTNKENRALFEWVVNECALEHAADVRCVRVLDGTFEDVYTFH